MKRWLLVLLLCLTLCGCSLMDGHYSSVEPYSEQGNWDNQDIIAVSDYQELRAVLVDMVENAVETQTISLQESRASQAEMDLRLAARSVMETDPIGAYAVENITYDIGSTGGFSAAVITVTYNHNRLEIRNIRQVNGMDSAESLIIGAMEQLQPGIVIRISGFRSMDLKQILLDYAISHPDTVMEIPEITTSLYPATGTDRVLELEFTYETSRDSLRSMQSYVRTKFSAAELFVSGEEDAEKYHKLYSFLMETSEYTMETSITPGYSLLRHGVGDSKAVASVYAAMCRRAGLECKTVTGTHLGEPWTWNLICLDGQWLHMDPVVCNLMGGYNLQYDDQMDGYVWDYAAYPACDRPQEEETEKTEPSDPEETEPPETEPQETEPSTEIDPTQPKETTAPTETTEGPA